MRILALDVAYHDLPDGTQSACVAGLGFNDWTEPVAQASYVSRIAQVAAYEPGAFYKRELPCLLALLQEYALKPECIVIDGYVYLDGRDRPGLGHHLHQALQQQCAVIGVAKSSFAGIDPACAIYRGDSSKALFITCAGMDLAQAQAAIAAMHGAYRMPDLLKQVDSLCRQA